MKKLSLICAALLIAGCGGGSDGGSTDTPPPVPAPTPPAMDAFFAAVSGVVSATPDDTEAANIDALAATAPDDSEPSLL